MDLQKQSSTLINDRFLGLILLFFGGVVLVYIYLQIHSLTAKHQREILKDTHVHFVNLMTAKEWNEFYGGVYVKKRPGIEENPYLPDHLTTDGNETLIHVNHFWMLRQLSERSRSDGYRFHLSSLTPKNPLNSAGDFEKRAYRYLESHPGAVHYYEFDEEAKKLYFLEPLRNTPRCLQCHPGEKSGDIRGGITIEYNIDFFYEDLRIRWIRAGVVGSIFIGMLILIFVLYRLLYRHDQALVRANISLEHEVKERTKRLAEKTSLLQTILDSSPDIIIVTNGEFLLRANRKFFEFFGYDSIESFKKEHDCVCDYFEKVDDIHYLQDKKIDDKLWPYYLLEHQDEDHKVQMTLDGTTSIFAIKARQLDTAEVQILVEFSDITKLENQRQEFEKIATTDQLTGIANRFHFELIATHLIEEAKRYDKPLSLIMFDIDHFKRVNDRFGHDVGDLILQNVADVIRNRLRSSDIFARWGGEEFVILLPGHTIHEAADVAEQLREGIEATTFEKAGRVTLSFGVSILQNGEDQCTMLKHADEALYRAKSNGRNRVEIKAPPQGA